LKCTNILSNAILVVKTHVYTKASSATEQLVFRISNPCKQVNQKSRPVIYCVKLMTLIMMQKLKKTTSIAVSSSQRLSEMRHENFYVMELKENGCHMLRRNL